MPLEFKRRFPHTRAIIDCTVYVIDQPSNKTKQYQTYSSYKSHNTFKCLVAVSLYGAFTFVSDLWSRNVSDKIVTENSGILDLIGEGDHIMADRGFSIEDLLLKCGASFATPPFTRQWNTGKGKNKRLNVKEIQKTRLIAWLHIHVERAMQAYQQGTKFPIAIKQNSGHINRSISKTYCLTPPLSQLTPCHFMTLATPTLSLCGSNSFFMFL